MGVQFVQETGVQREFLLTELGRRPGTVASNCSHIIDSDEDGEQRVVRLQRQICRGVDEDRNEDLFDMFFKVQKE